MNWLVILACILVTATSILQILTVIDQGKNKGPW